MAWIICVEKSCFIFVLDASWILYLLKNLFLIEGWLLYNIESWVVFFYVYVIHASICIHWDVWAVAYFGDLSLCHLFHLLFSPILKVVFFTLFTVLLAVQKLLSLIRSHLFIFVFIFLILGGGSWRILVWVMSYNVLPVFSSNSFIVFGLKFRSLIHFELMFVM